MHRVVYSVAGSRRVSIIGGNFEDKFTGVRGENHVRDENVFSAEPIFHSELSFV